MVADPATPAIASIEHEGRDGPGHLAFVCLRIKLVGYLTQAHRCVAIVTAFSQELELTRFLPQEIAKHRTLHPDHGQGEAAGVRRAGRHPALSKRGCECRAASSAQITHK